MIYDLWLIVEWP